MRYVHSGNEPLLIAGVGTYTLEILEQQPTIDVIIVPVGGGSGAAGACIVAKAINPAVRVIGVQSSAAPAAFRSWRGRQIVEDTTETIAEGLATRTAFELPQRILWQWLDDFVLVSDDEIRTAQARMIEATRNLCEAAGAAPLAAALNLRDQLAGRRIALVAQWRQRHPGPAPRRADPRLAAGGSKSPTRRGTRRRRSTVASVASRCGACPTAGSSTRCVGPAVPASMASSWAVVPYGSSAPCTTSTGHGDRRQAVLDVPRPERRREPHVVPAAEGGVDVVVVAGEALPQIGRGVGRRGRRRWPDADVLDEHVRRQEDELGDRMAGTGVQQGDRGAVAVADEDRTLDAAAASSAGSTTSASWCMYVTGRGRRAGPLLP